MVCTWEESLNAMSIPFPAETKGPTDLQWELFALFWNTRGDCDAEQRATVCKRRTYDMNFIIIIIIIIVCTTGTLMTVKRKREDY